MMSALPVEILTMIVHGLPLASDLYLRRTCRCVDDRIGLLSTLEFWRDRLISRGLSSLGWIFPGELEMSEVEGKEGDWATGLRVLVVEARLVKAEPNFVVGLTAMTQLVEDVILSLRLRKGWRIWKILRGVGPQGEELSL